MSQNISLEAVVKKYYEQDKSIHKIAEEYDTYPNKIRRMLTRAGYELRGKSEAQSLAISSGRTEHPTKGKKLSLETKEKISDKISEVWSNLTKKELNKRKKLAKEQWENKSDAEKQEMRRKAHEAIRHTAKHGSRLEKVLQIKLIQMGYGVQFHHKGLTKNETQEVDLYIPSLKLAIEIDGPSHFLPVWGEEALARQQNSDMMKYGELAASGIDVLRIKVLRRNITQKVERVFLEKVLTFLEEQELSNDGKLYQVEIT